MTTAPEELHVGDTVWNWLSVYAGNYALADRAFLRLRMRLESASAEMRPHMEEHLKILGQNRRAAYRDLVKAVAECETERQRLEAEESASW